MKKKETIMKTAKAMRTAIISLSLVLGIFPGAGSAAVVLEEDFSRPVKGIDHEGERARKGDTMGWRAPGGSDRYTKGYIEYDLDDFHISPSRGTIEFTLTRDEVYQQETPFTLLDAQGERVLSFRIYWENGIPGDPYPMIRISHTRKDGVWYTEVPETYFPGGKYPGMSLGRNVGKGGTVHFALTWQAGQAAVYVNGRKINAKKREGPSGIGPAVAVAKTLIVGAETSSSGIPEGAWSMTRSLIQDFRVHDVALTGSDLGQPVTESPDSQAVIASLAHDAAGVAGFSGKLVAGDTVTVAMKGTAGVGASFDVAQLADISGKIPLSWKGWGVYLEEITFFEDDQVNLRDAEEYRVYVSTDPIGNITVETPFVEALEVEEQSYTVDRVSVPDEGGASYSLDRLESGTPYYISVMALMDDGTFLPVVEPVQGLAMTEVEGTPGTYEGTFSPGYQNRYAEAVVVGHLGSGDGAGTQVCDEMMEVDPSLRIEVVTTPEELKADEKSTSEIMVAVTDANGDAVQDHEVRFVLATTSQYTGVVGGGQFADEVGGALDRDFRGRTDLFGRVTATYTAGFAAKTAIIVARDMVSNDTGAGYVKTYINATAQLELEAVQETAGKALGYTMTVTSSDEWLTADGESEARITAFVAQNGIPVEGHRVSFTVESGLGKIRTIKGETDASGKARAVYTAGTRIGVVLIRATDHSVAGLTGTVQIELRSDAPAKIGLTVTPEVLPADGHSRADVDVVVTDINDNPNEGVEVEYAVRIGSGRIHDVEPVTNRKGESSAEYVAGRLPGKVSIEVTVRSTVPTEEEFTAARVLATAVLDYDFY